jgi:hypothetical protein
MNSRGNLTNPDGSLLATVIPIGSNNGIVDSSGAVHIDARMTLQLTKDQHFMYLRAAGVFPNLDL